MVGERAATWMVKASFGAEWGPMTAETLLEMDERGSLGPGDLARCGDDGEWRSALEAVAELAAAAKSPSETSMADTATFAATDSAIALESDSPESTVDESLTLEVAAAKPAPSATRKRGLPGWTSFLAGSEATSPAEALPRFDGIDSWTRNSGDDDSPMMEDAAAESDTAEIPASSPPIEAPDSGSDLDLLNRWKQERDDRLLRLKGIVAEREAAAARATEAERAAKEQAEPPSAADVESTATDADSPPQEADSDAAAAPLESKSPTAPAKRVVRAEDWDQTLTRWKRSLPDWRIVGVLLVLPIMAWWLWPVSYGNVAETYHSMYAELRAIRDRPQDKTGMSEFVERSQAKLDLVLPTLKARANSQDQDTQLLLWIGRDCLVPMLKSPRTRDTKHEAMLKKLLAQWDSTHGIVRTEPPPSGISAKSEELVLPAPPPGSKPLGFGQSAAPETSEEPPNESPASDSKPESPASPAKPN